MDLKHSPLKGRDFLTLLDYTPEEIRYLLDLSAEFKARKKAGESVRYFEGRNVALIFEKTSTRTRCSFEVAAHDLGMGTTYLDPTGSQIGKKESIADTARVLSGMYDGIEYRGFGQNIVEELAKYSRVPVAARGEFMSRSTATAATTWPIPGWCSAQSSECTSHCARRRNTSRMWS